MVQHHGGEFPVRAPGWLGAWQRRQWRKGLEAASALSFTAQTQAADGDTDEDEGTEVDSDAGSGSETDVETDSDATDGSGD